LLRGDSHCSYLLGTECGTQSNISLYIVEEQYLR
jgi:hypothetical protein